MSIKNTEKDLNFADSKTILDYESHIKELFYMLVKKPGKILKQSPTIITIMVLNLQKNF